MLSRARVTHNSRYFRVATSLILLKISSLFFSNIKQCYQDTKHLVVALFAILCKGVFVVLQTCLFIPCIAGLWSSLFSIVQQIIPTLYHCSGNNVIWIVHFFVIFSILSLVLIVIPTPRSRSRRARKRRDLRLSSSRLGSRSTQCSRFLSRCHLNNIIENLVFVFIYY